MALSPYLFFEGDCAPAFEFYRSVFGGEFLHQDSYASAPEGMAVPEGEQDRLMHISLKIGEELLMGSDLLSTDREAKGAVGQGFAVSFHPKDKEEADRIFASLSENGEINAPMEVQFWGDYFGRCRDRFGIDLMLNVAAEK